MNKANNKTSSRVFFGTLLATIYQLLNSGVVHAQEGIYREDVAGIDWILILVQNILSIALRLIGVATFVMIIVGSYKILGSGGNPEQLDSGKKTLGMAIGGLVVASLAWIIFNLIARITGVEGILTVDIPTL